MNKEIESGFDQPNPTPAPDRHEASRAAFEIAYPTYDRRRYKNGHYEQSSVQRNWKAWCRALDHAAQEQPAPKPTQGSARETPTWDEVKQMSLEMVIQNFNNLRARFELVEKERDQARARCGAQLRGVELLREERDDLRAQLAAAQAEAAKLREALEEAEAAMNTAKEHCYLNGAVHHQSFDTLAIGAATLKARAALTPNTNEK